MIGFRIQKNPLEKTRISRRTMKKSPEIDEDPEMESESVPDLSSEAPSMEEILSPFTHRLAVKCEKASGSRRTVFVSDREK